MSGLFRLPSLERSFAYAALALGLLGCSASQPPTRPVRAAATPAPRAPLFVPPAPTPQTTPLVLLGIDVLEAQGFSAVKGKRIGLLTHPAGVNRNGVSTIDVLRRAPQTKLVALFGPEHGIYGNEKAEVNIANRVDQRTGLPVFSLYGKDRKPSKAMLKGLDAMVIDLQDIGTRSYTYVSA
ncbi:MAG TPA: exo-beta-N-acetylmuramidase NamZ domain-containing protein, partial [Opitutus sp.]|nr:exo-beta-N-acetylmuramidase NamZ domain-containing protein [Opitutus sp.]